MAKTCIRCGYERRATDTGPDYACPACGVVYAKAEAAHAAAQALRPRSAPVTPTSTPNPARVAMPDAEPPAAATAANARADALIRQMAAEGAAHRREPSAMRGMALVVLIAFSVGFASAAGMYSAAGKLRKPAPRAAAPDVADCAK